MSIPYIAASPEISQHSPQVHPVSQKTATKVIKIFRRVALFTGILSIATPFSLFISFVSGAAMGLTGKAALTALCLSVLKAFGIATVTALGTVGTFGLVWAIPVILLGISLLILHLSKSKISEPTEVPETPLSGCEPIVWETPPSVCQPIVWETRSKAVMRQLWEEHAVKFAQIAEQRMSSPPTEFRDVLYTHLMKFQASEEPVLTSAYIYFKKLKVKIDKKNVTQLLTACLCLAAKNHSDYKGKTDRFIEISKFKRNEFNQTERMVWQHLNFDLTITPEEFQKASNELSIRKHHA